MIKLSTIFQIFTTFLICCLSVAAQAVEAVPGEFIVRYKSNKNSISSLSKTSLNQNVRLKKSWDNINTHFFKTGSNNPSARDDAETLKSLREDPNVLFAEPNYLVRAQQISYFPTNSPIRAPESWSSGVTSANAVTVAVLDSGLDIKHKVFQNTGRLWSNQQEINGTPGVDDDGNGYIDDYHGWNFISDNNNLSDGSGHGTHVAGIVVSSSEDILNVSSANAGNQRVQVMVLKFLDSEGVGTTSDAINAVYYAVNNGAKVLNNSWGGKGYSGALHEAIAYSFFENTVFVAAAGNSGSDNDQSPIFPANYDVPNVISVGATFDSDSMTDFSNYGQSVHVSAPGYLVISTGPGEDGGDNYYSSSGTSMSTPFVSGLAALMAREAPHFSGFQLKRDILASVDVLSKLSTANLTSGRVNFEAAVNLAAANSSQATFNPDYTPNYDYSSRELASLNDGEDGGFGCGRVKGLYKSQNEKIESGKVGVKHIFMTLVMFMPFALIGFVRSRTSYKRKHERYRVDFNGALYNSEGKKVDVKVCTFSLGGAGVKINFKKEAFEGKSNLVLRFKTRSGEVKEYTCRAVSTYQNQIGLCFEQ